MVTARQVAERAGTSTAVVSYVFNNGPRGVSPAARERVLFAAKELGYRPNAMARALSHGRSNSIGLIVPDIANPFFGEMAHALEQAALASGNLLLIGDSGQNPKLESRLIDAMVSRQIDSVVLASVVPEPNLEIFGERNIPVVTLYPIPDAFSMSSVSIDYEKAAEDAVTHLLSHGYESIGLLNAPTDSVGGTPHEEGYHRGVSGTGVTSSVKQSLISRSSAAKVAREWLQEKNRPRAITCATDEQAFGVLFAAHQLGLSVPHELAVMGFDATANSAFSVPPLATIRQPILEIAERTVALLTNGTVLPVHERLSHELVPRESCGCIGRIGV